jgi:hypothetical protein
MRALNLSSVTAAAALGLLLVLPSAVVADACEHPLSDPSYPALARTDHQVSGNRVVAGCGPIGADVAEVDLGARPTWVLPDPSHRGSSWFVALEDGSIVHVSAPSGGDVLVRRSEVPPLAPGEPPLTAALNEDQLVVGSALTAAGWFEAPIPDARVTELDGGALVALTRPSDRYPHGVLGDELEATAIDVRDAEGLVARVQIEPPQVIEGISAMVVELEGAGAGQQLLATVSDAEGGARLVLFGLDGSRLAGSRPIGTGFRWLHQVGAGVLGPDGVAEVIAVRTPHIGGVVEAYRLVGDRLELVASMPGYSSHRIGSANLDMALLADVDADGRLEVVVPSQELDELGLLARTADGFEEIGRLVLDGRLATNLAATADEGGRLALAAGTIEERLRIFY